MTEAYLSTEKKPCKRSSIPIPVTVDCTSKDPGLGVLLIPILQSLLLLLSSFTLTSPLSGYAGYNYPVYQWSSIYSCSLHARSLSLVKACDSALNPYSRTVLVPLTVIFFMLPQNQALRSECLG